MEKLEIIITYDEGQDFIQFPASEIDFSISLSNWILQNLNMIVDMFVQDLIKTNGKFYFNI